MEMEMEKVESIRTTTQLEDVPEVIHCIQSMMSHKAAARTCILSKSWLHAWSTIPILRFRFGSKLEEIQYTNLIDRTLLRYDEDNIPVQSFDLHLKIGNPKLASFTDKWIHLIASKSSLKELTLAILVDGIDSFTLPNEIFMGENLNTITIAALKINSLLICSSPIINCVWLRVLKLEDVNMSDEALDNLLTTCSLLEKIKLFRIHGLKTVKVKKLLRLEELELFSAEINDNLEIDNVPSLLLFHYTSLDIRHPPFNTNSLGSVTQLHIHGVIVDNAFLDIIKSKFPILQRLTIEIYSWEEEEETEHFVITSVSLKMLTLKVWVERPINIQIYAPYLLSFFYLGDTKPTSLLVPTSATREIKILTPIG